MSRRGEKTEKTGVYRRDDGRYLVVATAKDPDQGKVVQRQKTLEQDSTIEDAVGVRDQIKEEIRTPATSKRKIRSLADYTERWIARKAKKVKPKTARTYADALEDRVLPVRVHTEQGMMRLGHIPIEDFKRRHVLQWIDEAESWTHPVKTGEDDNGEPIYEDKPYATSTLRKWWRVFRSVIKDLAAAGRIPRDFSERVDPPTTDRSGVREEPALELDELHAIAEAAPKSRCAEIVTLVHTGMRTGELWALRWEDLDREGGVIRICRSVSRGKLTEATKSHRDRVVPLFEPVAEAIDGHRERMMREQHPGLDTGLVFPSQVGTPRKPGSLRAAFRKIASELELDRVPTPQLIRKSVVTVLRDRGVPAMAAKALVGHSDDRIQEHYYSANDHTRDLARVLQKGGDTADLTP